MQNAEAEREQKATNRKAPATKMSAVADTAYNVWTGRKGPVLTAFVGPGSFAPHSAGITQEQPDGY